MAGVYIHIPFCKSRCIYCGFYSTTLTRLAHDYVNALCREADIRRGYINQPVETVYLGGGTPSQLPVEELTRLLEYIYKVFAVTSEAEITVECNPDDVTSELATRMAALGVNRVSLGAQTFSDTRLRFIRRRHNAAEVDKAVNTLRNAGINNISIDLMFGFPNENVDDWDRDISHAIDIIAPEHISAYSLMYEDGTPLRKMLNNGLVSEVSEETSLAMYELLADRLAAAGYEHYEISNFAKPGRRSHHNSSYWHGVPYIGLGAAAHSYDTISRQWNVSDVNQYIESINNSVIPAEREQLDLPTRYDDLVTTALRTIDGINLNKLAQTYGRQYHDYCLSQAKRYLDSGLLVITHDNSLRLTHKGLFVSDMVMSDLMMV